MREKNLAEKPSFARVCLQRLMRTYYCGKPLVPRSDWDEMIVTKNCTSFMGRRLSMRYICGPAGKKGKVH